MPEIMAQKSQTKSSTSKRAEINLHGNLKYFLSNHPHYLCPGLNFNKMPWVQKWNLECTTDLYRAFPYRCDLPKPLLPPIKLPKSVLVNSDPVLNLISTKAHIKDDVDRILDSFHTHQKDHVLQLKKDVHWVENNDKLETKLPRYLADLADLIEMDPDPFFEGKYNWYHTGGSLNSLMLADKNLILFPYMDELILLPLSPKENFMWKPIVANGAKKSIDNVIYELRHIATTQTCRIVARHKNQCTFYSVTEKNNKFRMAEVFIQKTKIPYVSVDISPLDFNQFSTLKFERLLEHWDMISGKCISKGSIISTKLLDDEWASIQYQKFNPNILSYTDRCCLHHIDIRQPLQKPVLSMCPKSHLEKCEYLSLYIPSDRESRYYIGTTHNLLMCDDRSPKQCVHQKWTHQFTSPPAYGSTIMRSEEEIIVLSGHMPFDTTIVINTWGNYDDPHSFYLPHKSPCMVDTLRECQQLGKCLDPSMKTRMNLSKVGMKLIMNDYQGIFIFTQNSIGDIFYQCITHYENSENFPLIDSHAYYALEIWERHILEQDHDIVPLTLTDQVNMKHIFDELSNTSLKYELAPQKEILLNSWKQSQDKLASYIDILAPELLTAWEIIEDGEQVLQTAPHQKVLSWLETASSKFTASQSQESREELELLTSVESQELISVSQQCRDWINIKNEGIKETSSHHAVKQKSGQEKKNKKSFVSGF